MVMIDEFEFPEDLFYDAKEHMWLRINPKSKIQTPKSEITIGIDDGGQDALGDVVYVQLNAAGRKVVRGEPIGSIEAAKMVRPLLAPVSGTLEEVNAAAVANPRVVNSDPYGEGWLVRIEADHWDHERRHFIKGETDVAAWVRGELAAHGRA